MAHQDFHRPLSAPDVVYMVIACIVGRSLVPQVMDTLGIIEGVPYVSIVFFAVAAVAASFRDRLTTVIATFVGLGAIMSGSIHVVCAFH